MPERRILHLTAPAPFGGLESVVTALARGQLEKGHAVTVAALVEPGTGEEHPVAQVLSSLDVPVATIEVPHRAYRFERRAVERLIRTQEPDVVHTHGYRADVVDAPVASRMGVPVVSTVHGFTRSGLKGRLYEWMQVRSLRQLDAVVVVSRPLHEELVRRGVPESALHIHPNAWIPTPTRLARSDARKLLGIPPDAFHVGWVGRLNHEKAPDVMLEALGRARDVPWVASFVGDGPSLADLERRCAELGLEDRVIWQGNVQNADAVMTAFDVLVLSSRTEGTPIVLLEGMAAGTPIVATSVGGVPDLVGDTAETVPPDRPEALAQAIRQLHDNPSRLRLLGRQGMARLQARTDESGWISGYDAVYDAAVARKSLRP